MKINRGMVVEVQLDPIRGHEQSGTRPSIVVSDSVIIADQRYELVAIVPLTTRRLTGVLYPKLAPGPTGLRFASFAMTDQIRSIDKERIVRILGEVPTNSMRHVEEGIRQFLGL